MVAELAISSFSTKVSCSLAKISMVAEQDLAHAIAFYRCSLAKISMVAEHAPLLK